MSPSHSVQESIDTYWTDRSAAYDAYQQRPERLEADRQAWGEVFSAALPAPPARVLDVGTGSGYVAMLLSDLGYQVTGVDHSEGMLDVARRHSAERASGPRIVFGDAVNPPAGPLPYHALTNRYLMWTLRAPATALAGWRRLLEPGGTLAVVDSTWFPDGFDNAGEAFRHRYDGPPEDALPLAKSRTINETADLIAAAGFDDVTITPLHQILELDRLYGVAPDHQAQLQYLITAHRPQNDD